MYLFINSSDPGHAGKSLEISNRVDIRSETNRELVMRLVSDVSSGNRFYTDLNGFQVFYLFLHFSAFILTSNFPVRHFHCCDVIYWHWW